MKYVKGEIGQRPWGYWQVDEIGVGDRTDENIPEKSVCAECNVLLEFEVGGNHKANSSSLLIERCKK
jgi:hypothetical protein